MSPSLLFVVHYVHYGIAEEKKLVELLYLEDAAIPAYSIIAGHE